MGQGPTDPSDVPTLNLTIKRGKTYARTFWWGKDENGTARSLSGFTGRGEIYDVAGTSGVLLATFTVTITAPTQTDILSVNRGITDEYKIVISLTAAATNASVTAIDTASNKGVYDIELVSGTTIYGLVQGNVIFEPDNCKL